MSSLWHARLVYGLVAVSIWLGAARAAQAYQPPPVQGHINDAAGVLTRAQVQSLESELSRVRQQHRFDVVVLIVASLGDEPIEDVAYDTFNTWGIGGEKRDDGVLLVLAVAEQGVRIETGKGIGGELTDIASGRIIREQIKPLVVAGQWYEATAAGTRAITETLTGVAGPRGPPGGSDDTTVELTLVQKISIGLGLVAVIILAVVFPGFRRVLFWILLGFLRARSGGGGGGGRSGGGGGSGGGGASG